jgi:hypothetical protein
VLHEARLLYEELLGALVVQLRIGSSLVIRVESVALQEDQHKWINLEKLIRIRWRGRIMIHVAIRSIDSYICRCTLVDAIQV